MSTCQAEDCNREVGGYAYCSIECSVYGEAQTERRNKEFRKIIQKLEQEEGLTLFFDGLDNIIGFSMGEPVMKHKIEVEKES